MHSEITMLRQYGPNVPEETLSRLVKAFSELRTMADEGQIQVIISLPSLWAPSYCFCVIKTIRGPYQTSPLS